jgi:carbonic anhydrase
MSYSGTQATLKRFDVRKLLPPHLTNYYRYSGSLTTPECYESVIWTVLKEHGTVSKSQVIFNIMNQTLKGEISKLFHT